MARIKKMEKGGALGMKSVKSGFDDNSGVTKADFVAIGKGEAQDGKKVSLRSSQMKRVGRLAAKNPDRAEKVAGRMVERATRKQRGKEYIQKNLSTLMPTSKSGGKIKKARNGATLSPSKTSTSNRLASYGRPLGKNLSGKLKMGGSVKKCKYGCK
jgi:hypothetical protein